MNTHTVITEAYHTTLDAHTVESFRVEGTCLKSLELLSQPHITSTSTEVLRAQKLHPDTIILSISTIDYMESVDSESSDRLEETEQSTHSTMTVLLRQMAVRVRW